MPFAPIGNPFASAARSLSFAVTTAVGTPAFAIAARMVGAFSSLSPVTITVSPVRLSR